MANFGEVKDSSIKVTSPELEKTATSLSGPSEIFNSPIVSCASPSVAFLNSEEKETPVLEDEALTPITSGPKAAPTKENRSSSALSPKESEKRSAETLSEDSDYKSPSQKRPSVEAPKKCITQSTKFRHYIGCSHISAYSITRKLGEGTFGEVHKGVHSSTSKSVALKRILMHNEREGLPITALREIKILKALSHINVLSLSDMVYVKADTTSSKPSALYMVTPYMDHDLSGLLDNPKVKFTLPQIKCYMKQILEGIFYLHANNILHRDIKTSNILVNNDGILKIADFGLARASLSPGAQYTSSVITRWYRPPELLLGQKRYTSAIDLWGVGCVFGQLLQSKPLLPGNSDLDQLDLIFRLCGSPTEETMPGFKNLPGSDMFDTFPFYKRRIREQFSDFDEYVVDLLDKLLLLDPKTRLSADDALCHLCFYLEPLPALPSSLPFYESSHEYDRRNSKPDHRNNRLDLKKEIPPHLQQNRLRTESGSSARRAQDLSRHDNLKRFHGGNGWRRSGTGRDQNWDIDSRSGLDSQRFERHDSIQKKYPDQSRHNLNHRN